MANKSPAFQFYPDDWLSSTKINLMTPAQEGAYIRLLCHAWNDPTCSLPDDDEQLAKLSRLGEGWFNGDGRVVRGCFKTRAGKLINSRLLLERKKQKVWREKSRAGGISSGKARREKAYAMKGGSKGGCVLVEPNTNSSSSSSSSSSEQSSAVVTVRSVLAADAATDFPETAEAIREHYDVDDEFIHRIILAAQGAKPGATDDEMAEAVEKTYRNSKQRSAGLWLRTVPRYLSGHEEEFLSPAARQMARMGRVVREDGSPL